MLACPCLTVGILGLSSIWLAVWHYLFSRKLWVVDGSPDTLLQLCKGSLAAKGLTPCQLFFLPNSLCSSLTFLTISLRFSEVLCLRIFFLHTLTLGLHCGIGTSIQRGKDFAILLPHGVPLILPTRGYATVLYILSYRATEISPWSCDRKVLRCCSTELVDI